LSAPAAVALDDDDDRAAERAEQPAVRRRGLLFSVRPRLHREPDAAAGEAADVHHDGKRDLAQTAVRRPPWRNKDGAGQRTHLFALVSALPPGAAVLPPRAVQRRSLLHAGGGVGAAHYRDGRRSRERGRHRPPAVRPATLAP